MKKTAGYRPLTNLLVGMAQLIALCGFLGAETPAPVAPLQDYRSPFWKISSAQATMYVLGSVQYGGKVLLPLPAVVEQAFQGSDYLVLENDLREDPTESIQYMFNEYGRLGPDETLDGIMEPGDLAQVAKGFDELGMPFQVLKTFRPWVLWYLVPRLVQTEEEAAVNPVLEHHFLKQLGNRQVFEIGGPELIIRFMSEAPDPLMARVLAETMSARLPSKELAKISVDAWLHGNHKLLAEELRGTVDDLRVKEYLDKLQERRTTSLLERLETLLNNKGVFLVILDLPFVQGDQGIPARLEALGYPALPLVPVQ